VLLRRAGEGDAALETPLLGIELKGWYLLAKEGEPSFRYLATAAACAPADMIAVVPWALTNVISGSPIVFSPYIASARYAADYRNYHWQNLRSTSADTTIRIAGNIGPYPKKSDAISDVPLADSGGNFGRFARTGLMDDYLGRARQELLSGIRAEHWLGFFKIFQDQKSRETISGEIDKLRKRLDAAEITSDARCRAAHDILASIERLLD
jgi:hypothetical protein